MNYSNTYLVFVANLITFVFQFLGLFQSWRQTESKEQFRLRIRVNEHNQRECRQFDRQRQRECRQFDRQRQWKFRHVGRGLFSDK